MTTPEPAKLTTAPNAAPAAIAITLEKLCGEMKIIPREARMLLRLAAKQKDKYPNLGKDHVARQPWQWASGSKGLDEARKVLTTAPESK